MLYHAGLPLRHGYVGVDVFFVISGFLITSILLREIDTEGTISWSRFVGRRVRRLLPAAATVLAVTAVAAWFVVPGLRRQEIGVDVAGAALYVVNWVLADRAVDYLASDAGQSPVQHFWSLAVEEQFYVVWPLALIGLCLLVRRLGRGATVPSRRAVGGLLAAMALPSFGYAVWLAATDPARSYFVTTTRVWELGVGAAVAVGLFGRTPRSPGRREAAIGWLGLAAVLGSAAMMPGRVAWPGAWSLLPTLGTAAVLYAGWTGAREGPVRLLGTAPLVWVGGLSYSLYLWHWPALVLAESALGHLAPVQKAALVLVSAVPAWASHRFIERPVHLSRRMLSRPRLNLGLGAALTSACALAAVPLLMASSPFRTDPVAGARPSVSTLGAATLPGPQPEGSAPEGAAPQPAGTAHQVGDVDRWEWLVPDPQRAAEDRPKADVDHCQVDRLDDEPVACEFGVPDAATTVALVGDSKALQWLPALERLAPQRGWRIVTYGKSSCAFAAGEAQLAGAPYTSCDAWNAKVVDRLRAEPPDLLVTSSRARDGWDGHATSTSALVDGLSSRWREVSAMGTPVVVLGDSPASPDDLDLCTARHATSLTACAFDRTTAVERSGLPAQRQAAARATGVDLVDLTAWICPQRCPVAIGHVAVHRPGDHITATYATTLAGVIGPRLDRALHRPSR